MTFLSLNGFRVLGLPGEATWSEIVRAAERLRGLESWGAWSSPWDLPMLGTVRREPSDVDAALARLADTSQRLVDRLFWFHERDSESAVTYLTAASIRDALEGWSITTLPVAKHDAAMVALLASLTLDHDVEDPALWSRMLREWTEAIEHDEYWLEVMRVEMEGGFENPASLGELGDLRETALPRVAGVLLGRAREAIVDGDGQIAMRALAVLRGELPIPLFDELCGELATHLWGGGVIPAAATSKGPVSDTIRQHCAAGPPAKQAPKRSFDARFARAPRPPTPAPVVEPPAAPAVRSPAPPIEASATPADDLAEPKVRAPAPVVEPAAPEEPKLRDTAWLGGPPPPPARTEAAPVAEPARGSSRPTMAEHLSRLRAEGAGAASRPVAAPPPAPAKPREAPSAPTMAEPPAVVAPIAGDSAPAPIELPEPRDSEPAPPAFPLETALPAPASEPARPRRRVPRLSRRVLIGAGLAAGITALFLMAPWPRSLDAPAPVAATSPGDPIRNTILTRIDAADDALARLIVERAENQTERAFLRRTIADYRILVADYQWRMEHALPYDPAGYNRVNGYLEDDLAQYQAATSNTRAIADRFNALVRERSRLVSQYNQRVR